MKRIQICLRKYSCFQKIVCKSLHKRRFSASVRLREKSRRLVHQQYVSVFINNIHVHLPLHPRGFRVPGKLLKSIVSKKKLHMIAQNKFLISGCFFSVQSNVFFPEHFVAKAFRRLFKKFCQIFVETLSRFVFSDNKFFHNFPTGISPGWYV